MFLIFGEISKRIFSYDQYDNFKKSYVFKSFIILRIIKSIINNKLASNVLYSEHDKTSYKEKRTFEGHYRNFVGNRNILL